MGSEDSVEAREEGGSRRSSVGEDDRYSQKISAINEGYREKTYHYARYTRLLSLAPVPSAFISKTKDTQNTHCSTTPKDPPQNMGPGIPLQARRSTLTTQMSDHYSQLREGLGRE